jgi:hypothetical protein
MTHETQDVCAARRRSCSSMSLHRSGAEYAESQDKDNPDQSDNDGERSGDESCG